MRTPTPGLPSMPPHEPSRVTSPLPPTPSLPWLPVPSWSPLPRPAASTLSSPTPVRPCFQATPQRLNFSNASSPRVVIELQLLSLLPLLVLPTRKPISHRTCSCALASLVLFTAGQPFHECVTYHIPTTKSVRSSAKPINFAGLCKTMQPALTFCISLSSIDACWQSRSSVGA
jgi:hypothetical protein